MCEQEKERTWLQCTNCGCIYIIERQIPIEKVFIDLYCNKCGNGRALNCGYSEDDLSILKDAFLDERYY